MSESPSRADRVARWAAIAPLLSDIVILMDGRGGLIECLSGLDTLNWPMGSASGVDVLELLQPEDVNRVRALLDDTPPGASRTFDVRLRAFGGGFEWYEASVSDLRRDDDVGSIVFAARPIAGRKRVEQELLRREARFKALVQHTSDVMLILDAMLRIRYTNPACHAYFGVSPTRAIGRRITDFIPEYDQEAVTSRLLDLVHGTGEGYLEFHLARPDGDEIHVEATARNLLDHPSTNGIVLSLRDLADRDHAVGAYARSEQRFRKLIRNISDTVTILDADGRVRASTGQAKMLLGHPDSFWNGRSILDAVHPDDRSAAAEFFAEIRHRPGHEVDGEFRLLSSTGRYDDVELFAVNLEEDPDMQGVVLTTRVITARKATERALARAHRDALDALAAKAEFVAMVGHEVRTPVHGIVGFTELLAESDLTTDQLDLVLAVQRSGESLSLVINDLLDFSKLEAGRLELVEEACSLRQIVDDVVRLLAIRATAKGLTLTSEIADGVPRVILADGLRLQQVLTNLAGNAVKYTERGMVAIRIDALDLDDSDQHQISIAVADSGIGISPVHQERLFEPFAQVEGVTMERDKSTGLGLTISRQLVELMGGQLNLDSTPGVGTTFTVRFDARAAVSAPAVGPTEVISAIGSGEAVLVVEDSPVNQVLIERQLLRLGFDAQVVSSGEEAIEVFERTRVHVVLLDRHLPGIDGIETARRLRAIEIERNDAERVPMICLTGSATAQARDEALAAGMDAVVVKPVRLRDLSEVLRRATNDMHGVGPHESLIGSDPEVRDEADVFAYLLADVGDAEIVRNVLRTYAEQLDIRIQAMADALESNDRELLERTVHTLGSTSISLGLRLFGAQCQVLEQRIGGDTPLYTLHDDIYALTLDARRVATEMTELLSRVTR